MTQTIQHNETLEPALFRFSIAAFDRLCEEGIFADQRVELIDGLILEVAPMNDLHYKWLLELHDVLFLALQGKARVSQQTPIKLEISNTKPLPDFTIIPLERYSGNVPDPTEAALVIEISDSTLETDKGIKLQRYAQAGIKEYWVVDAKAEKLEVYREPEGNEYRSKQTLDKGKAATMLEFEDVPIRWWI
jgi:Uma2 family endonuclease